MEARGEMEPAAAGMTPEYIAASRYADAHTPDDSTGVWSAIYATFLAGRESLQAEIDSTPTKPSAGPSEALLDEIIWSEIPADGGRLDAGDSHCLICGGSYPRHLDDCRYAALRITKEGE